MNFILVCLTASVRPFRMKYQRIFIELQAIRVAGIASKVQGVAA